MTCRTFTPITAATSRSSATARMQRPSVVRWTSTLSSHISSSATPTIITSTRAEMRTPPI